MKDDGYLILGHSEKIEEQDFRFQSLGHSIYKKISSDQKVKKQQVLLVDSQVQTQETLQAKWGDHFVVKPAGSIPEASRLYESGAFDLIVIDRDMPGMTGDQWIREQKPRVPVILISDTQSTDAEGVLEVLKESVEVHLEKPDLKKSPSRLVSLIQQILDGRKEVIKHSAERLSNDFLKKTPAAIFIGASTGGPQTLFQILSGVTRETPPIVIVQHISENFRRPFVNSLCRSTPLIWTEPQDGQVLQPGHVYMAVDDQHIFVKETSKGLEVCFSKEEPLGGHRPSVDFLFQSGASIKAHLLGILLTGMGKDGAEGLLQMKKSGHQTLIQDASDCVVYGMPKVAWDLQAADHTGTISQIKWLIDQMSRAQKVA